MRRGTRQGSDDVGKSSGFGKRDTLGCGKQDVHEASAKLEQELDARELMNGEPRKREV